MTKQKKVTVKALDALYDAYDTARSLAHSAELDKKEAGDAIKTLLGDTVEASTPEYTVTYKYDKDRVQDVFDEEKFATKDPSTYQQYLSMLEHIKMLTKKYTKSVVTSGSRKLIVMRKEEAL